MTTGTSAGPESALLDGLNEQQRRAVTTLNGAVLVVAGPGSGKTRVIAHRATHIARSGAAKPHEILAVTFTNKAAREMQNRVNGMAADPLGPKPAISTFHSFCARLLRAEAASAGLSPEYTIYDEEDQNRALKFCLEELELQDLPIREVKDEISACKSKLISRWEYQQGIGPNEDDTRMAQVARIWELYDRQLRQNAAVDFDDLLTLTAGLLQSKDGIRERIAGRYRYLMVDEFQDTNPAQYELTRLLGTHGNICVVGDPDQSIYSWRNADLKNVGRFLQDHPEASVITLGQNYRSTNEIVSRSSNLIQHNRRPVENLLYTENGPGIPALLVEHNNVTDEAQWLIEEVRRLQEDEGILPGDCAVLYRTNACSRAIEEECVINGLRCQVVGGIPFYRRKEVKDITAYLTMTHNPLDTISLLRIINTPARGLGDTSVRALTGYARMNGVELHRAIGMLARGEIRPEDAGLRKPAAKAFGEFAELARTLFNASRTGNPGALIEMVIEGTGMERHIMKAGEKAQEKWENVIALKQAADRLTPDPGRQSLTDFLSHSSLMQQADEQTRSDDTLTLITIHQAKGLEFPVVFLVGMEQGMLPHAKSMHSSEARQEERRLCYVAVTRAMDRLYLTRTTENRGHHWGDEKFRGKWSEPSVFLEEMFPEL